MKRVHGYSPRAQVSRHTLTETVKPGLIQAVHTRHGQGGVIGNVARDKRDSPSLTHVTEHSFAADIRSSKINRHNVIEILKRELLDRLEQ